MVISLSWLRFQVQNFLTPAESNAFVKVAESFGFVHQGSLGPTKGEAYRDNDRISVTDPLLANAIWESGLNKLFSDIKIRGRVAVGLNPNIRFYRFVLLYSITKTAFCTFSMYRCISHPLANFFKALNWQEYSVINLG